MLPYLTLCYFVSDFVTLQQSLDSFNNSQQLATQDNKQYKLKDNNTFEKVQKHFKILNVQLSSTKIAPLLIISHEVNTSIMIRVPLLL